MERVERGRGRTYLEEGLSLQQDALKGLYMGRHVGWFFFCFFFYCFEQKKGGVYSSGMAYAAD